VSAYRQEGYTGWLMRFSGLTFDQLGQLSAAAGPNGQKVQFALRRAGNRLIVSGKVDLTTVPVDKADFQLKITTSGEVLETNGDADGGTASWTFDPGKVGDVSAVIAADDPNAPSPLNWTFLTAGLVALACAAVVLVARRTRNPPVR
jgi:LppM domain